MPKKFEYINRAYQGVIERHRKALYFWLLLNFTVQFLFCSFLAWILLEFQTENRIPKECSMDAVFFCPTPAPTPRCKAMAWWKMICTCASKIWNVTWIISDHSDAGSRDVSITAGKGEMSRLSLDLPLLYVLCLVCVLFKLVLILYMSYGCKFFRSFILHVG